MMMLGSRLRKGSLILVALCCAGLMLVTQAEGARKKDLPPKIIYIPHDNRPVSNKQTAEVVEKLGYEVVVPPDELLGNRNDMGHPEELWKWLEGNALDADAAVIASDSMLYGSLVGSRKHNYSKAEVLKRAEMFKAFHKRHPQTQLYVFSSIMRTPRTGAASGHQEPEYYSRYGEDIFRYTELKDKEEMEGLSTREKRECQFLETLIPKKDLADWLGRREKNMAANMLLIDLMKLDTFHYLALGRDDNAPYSQTHLENRHLAEFGKSLDKNRFQSLAGIDEIGLLLLTRTVNEMRGENPSVFVRYNWGRGGRTIPAYSDEYISDSIDAAIVAAGGMMAASPGDADFVLTVNTNPNGQTYEAYERSNNGSDHEGSEYFADIVSEYVAKGYPVGIADIAYANGADNALMEQLKSRGLLFKLRAYSGWNTPTNSTGFAVGTGMLAKNMTDESVDELLLTRYLDDWAYQSNVRGTMARQLSWLRGDGVYASLDDKLQAVSQRTTVMMERFVAENLPPFAELDNIWVVFPWNRMFEADIRRGAAADPLSYFER